jgi:hypothetical protein
MKVTSCIKEALVLIVITLFPAHLQGSTFTLQNPRVAYRLFRGEDKFEVHIWEGQGENEPLRFIAKCLANMTAKQP